MIQTSWPPHLSSKLPPMPCTRVVISYQMFPSSYTYCICVTNIIFSFCKYRNSVINFKFSKESVWYWNDIFVSSKGRCKAVIIFQNPLTQMAMSFSKLLYLQKGTLLTYILLYFTVLLSSIYNPDVPWFQRAMFLKSKPVALHKIILFHKKWKSYSLKAQIPFQIYDALRIFHLTRCTHHEMY